MLDLMVTPLYALTPTSAFENTSTRPYEILTVSFLPYYLPRELGQVTVILVSPSVTTERSIGKLTRLVRFVLGDFNCCDITRLLSDLYQGRYSRTTYEFLSALFLWLKKIDLRFFINYILETVKIRIFVNIAS